MNTYRNPRRVGLLLIGVVVISTGLGVGTALAANAGNTPQFQVKNYSGGTYAGCMDSGIYNSGGWPQSVTWTHAHNTNQACYSLKAMPASHIWAYASVWRSATLGGSYTYNGDSGYVPNGEGGSQATAAVNATSLSCDRPYHKNWAYMAAWNGGSYDYYGLPSPDIYLC